MTTGLFTTLAVGSALLVAGTGVALSNLETAQEAADIAAIVEDVCQAPQYTALENLSAGIGNGSEVDATSVKCADTGAAFQPVVAELTARFDAVTDNVPAELVEYVGASQDALTPDLEAAVSAGDIVGAIRMLFSTVAPGYGIEVAS